MKKLAIVLMSACMAVAAGGAAAQEVKKDAMAKDKKMTMQECKDHMAMQKKEMKKDDATMKKDAMCAEMMKAEEKKK